MTSGKENEWRVDRLFQRGEEKTENGGEWREGREESIAEGRRGRALWRLLHIGGQEMEEVR